MSVSGARAGSQSLLGSSVPCSIWSRMCVQVLGGQGSTLFECLGFEGGDKAVSEVLGELAPRMKKRTGGSRDLSLL